MTRPHASAAVSTSASAALLAGILAPVSLAPPAWADTAGSGAGKAAEAHHFMQIDGAPVAWRETGDPGSPTALLLHEATASRARIGAWMRELSDRYRVIAPDDPIAAGPGASPDEARAAAALAAALPQLLDELGVERASIRFVGAARPVAASPAGAI